MDVRVLGLRVGRASAEFSIAAEGASPQELLSPDVVTDSTGACF